MSPEQVSSIITLVAAGVLLITFAAYYLLENRNHEEVVVPKENKPIELVDKPVVVEIDSNLNSDVAEAVAEVVVAKAVAPIEPYSNIFRNIDMEQMPEGTEKQQIVWIREQKQAIARAAKQEPGEGKGAPRVITFKISEQHLKDWQVYVGRHALLAFRQVDKETIGSATS